METSDSECFESADEDFASEDESVSPTVSEKKEISVKEETNKDVRKGTSEENKTCPAKSTDESKIVTGDLKEKLKQPEPYKGISEKNEHAEGKDNRTTDVEKKNLVHHQITLDTDSNITAKVEEKIETTDECKKEYSEEKNIGIEIIEERVSEIDVCKLSQTKNINKASSTFEPVHQSGEPSRKFDCDFTNAQILQSENKQDTSSRKVTSEENMWDVNDDDWSNDWQDDENLDESKKSIKLVKEKGTDNEENFWKEDEINWVHEKSSTEQENQEENMWENDEDWESIDNVKDKESSNNNTWGGWSNWGVTTILNSATQSVSSIRTQVSHGLNSVLETGIGAPDPEEMARIVKSEEGKLQHQKNIENKGETPSFGFGNLGNLVSGVTKLVETTGTRVISGGLDTLETIGKKTMEVLQEGDPGLKKKRALLKLPQDKPILSQVLREAKEKAEEENNIREQKHLARITKNYETLFDDFQGLVHLEALEMLSRQCDIKLDTLKESLSLDQLSEMQETMDQVKELCELPEDEEDDQLPLDEVKEKLRNAVNELNVAITYDKLISTWEESDNWLNTVKLEFCNERELHQQAIETLAQITAMAVEQFHKGGELLLIKEHRSTADEADSLVQLTTSLKSLMIIIAGKFTEKINELASRNSSKENCNDLITNVFFEAANSSSYIQNAFQLLIPILQVGAV